MKGNMDLLALFLMVICESVSQKNVRENYRRGRLYLKDQTQGRVNTSRQIREVEGQQ